jgi:hypothetical protein
MKHITLLKLAFTLILALASIAGAQEKRPPILAFGSDSPERGTTRVGYWDTTKNKGGGQFALDYGRPVWQAAYEDAGRFDTMTKGKTWRMGSNYWTTLDTDMPLTISGKTVPAGLWYLGLHRSDDGSKWSLVFIDPAKARTAHMDASEVNRAPVEFEAPVAMEAPGELRDKLTIDLAYQQSNLQEVTLKIAWGKLRLSAPIKVPIGS